MSSRISPLVQVQEVLGHIINLFPANVTVLFQQVLMTTYFQYSGDFHTMVDGVTMDKVLP